MIAYQTSISLSILLICIIDGSLSLDKFNELGDSSGPLFSIYSKTEEEHDIKRAERHQKDAEGIVIFVSSYFCLHASEHIDRKYRRLAYSPLLLLH